MEEEEESNGEEEGEEMGEGDGAWRGGEANHEQHGSYEVLTYEFDHVQ